jgi:hypothetical protein
MKIAVLSDNHHAGLDEQQASVSHFDGMGQGVPAMRRRWRRGLHRMRRQLWNTHPETRSACFEQAVADVKAFKPDLVVAAGDYGGDVWGVGISHDHTFESVREVVDRLRAEFPDRCRFIYGDHELGKYSTDIRHGGIRIQSLIRGERDLGIRSFWHERRGDYHLIGINSTLVTLDLFLREAVEQEIPLWEEYRHGHMKAVVECFESLPRDARVLLFCHDPGALSVLAALRPVHERRGQIERTILGHLHSPRLMPLTRIASHVVRWVPEYPVARIIAHGARGAKEWKHFNPVVCPSTFGVGHHFHGGCLLIEAPNGGDILVRRHKITLNRKSRRKPAPPSRTHAKG